MLTIPDIRQGDDYSCGAACLAALFSFHRTRPPLWLRRLPNRDRGMSPDTIEAVLFDGFGRPPLRGRMVVDDLRHLTRSGRPVICPVICPVIWSEVSHWVVVRGVARGRVYIHDPMDGPVSMAAAEWHGVWRDKPRCSPHQRFGITGWPG